MGHIESKLPEGKKWKLVWADEFDGDTLDMNKWSFRHHLFHRHFPSYTEEGVYVKDGCLHIGVVEKDGNYYSAQLQTGENFHDRPSDNPNWIIAPFSKPKFMHRYGYYECRCKLPMQKGWWAAFWLQSPIIGCSPDPAIAGVEVDIMETFCDYGKISRETVSNNCHWSGYGADYKTSHLVKVPLKATDDDFHVFAVEWNRDGYIFYTDGIETNRMNMAVSHTDQFILLTTECEGYRMKEESPSEDLKKIILPDEFVVDYVRVWDEIE